MTLDTRVFIRGEVDYQKVFRYCQTLVSGGRTNVRWKDDPDWHGTGCISNEPMQNLCAWLMVHYKPGGQWLVAEGEHHRYCHDEDDENEDAYDEEDRETLHNQCFPTFVEVSFDTAYSYDGPEGGCGDLHVRLVSQLGLWLKAQGIPWSWENEFTGEVFEEYAGLDQLGSGGEHARRWLTGTVLPAVGHALRNGEL